MWVSGHGVGRGSRVSMQRDVATESLSEEYAKDMLAFVSGTEDRTALKL